MPSAFLSGFSSLQSTHFTQRIKRSKLTITLPTQATPGYSDATRPPPRTPEEQVLAQPVAQPVLAGPSPLSLANTAAAAAPKGRGGDLGATTWAGSGDLGGTKATTRAA